MKYFLDNLDRIGSKVSSVWLFSPPPAWGGTWREMLEGGVLASVGGFFWL